MLVYFILIRDARYHEPKKKKKKFVVSLGVHSLLLCFVFSVRVVVFELVGRPVGKTPASIHRGARHT